MSTHILGISAFYHDSAACLLRDGEIVAAAQEERFSRKKNDERFPKQAVAYCLAEAGINIGQIDAVAYYDKPMQTFARLAQSYLEYPWRCFRSFSRSLPLWTSEKLRIPAVIDRQLPGYQGPIYFSRHHESHAASAFFCSPFEEAALIVVDGVGEWACTSIGQGRGNQLQMLKEVRFPHSLGLFYTAITQYLGFKVNSDEYKVMGLAPYGEPKYVQKLLDNVLDLKPDGSLALNLRYFKFVYGLTMITEELGRLLGRPQRGSETQLEQFHMDVAASVQAITTEAMLRLAVTAKDMTGLPNLCLSGGVALNCVANGAIYRSGVFEDIYVQPAAGDAGGALGAALQVWHQVMQQPRQAGADKMHGAHLGPTIVSEDAEAFLRDRGAAYQEVSADRLATQVAEWIAAGHVIGFCQGRMEFGPRALGSRSILGDPRDPATQSRINLKVKYRESFRPFAPAILEEEVKSYFDIDIPSPYMLIVMPVLPERRFDTAANASEQGLAKLKVLRSDVPAITHVDYSVRLQTVNSERNGIFYDVVRAFYELTGCPMIVNTSFNVRGEPIVCDHEDAYRCFLMTDIDILVLDRFVIVKPGVDLSAPPRLTLETQKGGLAHVAA